MRYIIVFLVKGIIKSKIDQLRKEISKKFYVYEALKYPPHLTLKYPFETDNIKLIEKFLQEFSKKYVKFPLKLKNFNHFDDRVWLIDVIENPHLITMRKELTRNINNFIDCPIDTRDNKIPFHVTLAYKDVIPEKFKKIGKFLENKEISEDIIFDNITILKFSKGKWGIYKEYLL